MSVKYLVSCVGALMAAQATGAPPQLRTADWSGITLRPTHYAPIFVIDGVEVRGEMRPTGGAFEERLDGYGLTWDSFQGDQSVAGDFPPIGGDVAPCALAPSSRYFFGTAASNVHWCNDFNGQASVQTGEPILHVRGGWYFNPITCPSIGEPWRLDILWYNEFNGACEFPYAGSDSITAARGFIAGWSFVFANGGVVPCSNGYYTVALTIADPPDGARMPDSDGAYRMRSLRTNPTGAPVASDFTTRAQPMLWGTEGDANGPYGGQRRPGAASLATHWNDDGGATGFPPMVDNAFNANPDAGARECYDYAFNVCYRPLGAMVAWFGKRLTEVYVHRGGEMNLGVKDAATSSLQGWIYTQLGLLDEFGALPRPDGDLLRDSENRVVGRLIRTEADGIIGVMSLDGSKAAYNMDRTGAPLDRAWSEVAPRGRFVIASHGVIDKEPPDTRLTGIELRRGAMFHGFRPVGGPGNGTGGGNPVYELPPRVGALIRVRLVNCYSAFTPPGRRSIVTSIKDVPGVDATSVEGYNDPAQVSLSISLIGNDVQKRAALRALRKKALDGGFLYRDPTDGKMKPDVAGWAGKSFGFPAQWLRVTDAIAATGAKAKMEWGLENITCDDPTVDCGYYEPARFIGPSGGVIEYFKSSNHQSFRIDVPEGALAQDTVMILRPSGFEDVSRPEDLQHRSMPIEVASLTGAAFSFVPPATLSIRFFPNRVRSDSHAVYRLVGESWEPFPSSTVDVEAGTAVAFIPGSGVWAVFGPPDCVADFNGDGMIDFFDYLDFVQAFSDDDLDADVNGDGQVDFFDYLDFIFAYDRGC